MFSPKCRADYTQQLIPTRYHCYCEKVTDPSFDPWLVPHSCGSRCEKPLQPECSHICLLLCHPGIELSPSLDYIWNFKY